MRLVSNKEISTFKILPFDIYDESNVKILAAGEVLTPGKLIVLKGYTAIFTEESTSVQETPTTSTKNTEDARRLANFSYEKLDETEFETVINKDGLLPLEIQVKIKYFYKKTLDLFLYGYYEEGVQKLHELAGILITDVLRKFTKGKKCSQIRFMGEYELCHPLNVAIVSTLIAKKIDYTNLEYERVLMAGLLHDIGKFRITLPNKSALTTLNEEEVERHTVLGYDLIKNRLGFPEEIAKAALEHHENNDGSGYPKGLSSDYISEIAQIINVANYYDNIAFNRTSVHIASNRDVLRAMLEIGTKRFSAKILYTFIHMFTYDDPKEFAEMTI